MFNRIESSTMNTSLTFLIYSRYTSKMPAPFSHRGVLTFFALLGLCQKGFLTSGVFIDHDLIRRNALLCQ